VGSSWGAASPICHKATEELVGLAAEACLRPEPAREPELGRGLVALAGPGEQQAQVVTNALTARKAPDERPEPGERRCQVVLVEAPDRGGHLCLVACRVEARRLRVEALGRVLVALSLREHPAHE